MVHTFLEMFKLDFHMPPTFGMCSPESPSEIFEYLASLFIAGTIWIVFLQIH